MVLPLVVATYLAACVTAADGLIVGAAVWLSAALLASARRQVLTPDASPRRLPAARGSA